eukprot:12526737-Alexandrium_andersonii.AAC.1
MSCLIFRVLSRKGPRGVQSTAALLFMTMVPANAAMMRSPQIQLLISPACAVVDIVVAGAAVVAG